ncbi:MAG: KEOPS complex subunit Bud32 [Candidatus Argoarchaeum ethanivorans]|uniref:non-specific serine/threonine protein kinase n=1 Tax=Candidatus Argoarchaeum ethanivorans TaxID=2608793 RepID=A0A811T357_9EURY|nr:MAG: KEOPS complex subunit Bud32 [Candidatus Argoarchaeum ethanivorans]
MILAAGAEAVIDLVDDVVVKHRIEKKYRLSDIDLKLRQERTRAEAKIMSAARRLGVSTPIIYDLNTVNIVMEYIDGTLLKHVIDTTLVRKAGEIVGMLHRGGIIHGDLTTSNMLYHKDRIYLIDFGLAFFDTSTEARGVDVHVFFQTLKSSHEKPEELKTAFMNGYRMMLAEADQVFQRVREIEKRGRYA